MREYTLRKLPFGEHGASLLTSSVGVWAYLKERIHVACDARSVGPITRFKASALSFPDLTIAATAADPFHVAFSHEPGVVPIFIPLSGSGRIASRGHDLPWTAVDHMVFDGCGGEQAYHFDTPHSTLFLLLGRARLTAAMDTMFGMDCGQGRDILLERAAVASVSAEEANLRTLLLACLSLADLPGNDADYLKLIGYDDVILRIAAKLYSAFLATGGAEEPALRAKRSLRALDVVCDYIAAHGDRPLTLSEMERMTGVTSRSLNNAFHERFNCSPQEWQRNYRLDQARAELLRGNGTTSVKSIARQFGFISTTSFSSFYKKRFGELPSKTGRRT